MPERRDDQATLAGSLGEAAAPCGIARRSLNRTRPDAPARPPARSRRTLFQKYFLALSVAMVVPLVANGAAEAWFGYRDQRARLDDLLRAEVRGAAARIQGFMDGIRDQLGWTVQLPWSEETAKGQQLTALRLLRQVPAIVDLARVDGEGRERLYLSRLDPNRIGSGIERSGDPAVSGARSAGAWYGPVTYRNRRGEITALKS
jgi:adenylate cyclase